MGARSAFSSIRSQVRHIFASSLSLPLTHFSARVSRLCYGLDPEHVDPVAITQKIISGVYQGVTTIELDNLVSHDASPPR
jgi:hypothetical protein